MSSSVYTADSIDEQKDRSVSRGREYQSSGRGGAGNIRPSSHSRDPLARTVDGPDDFSPTRGRELPVNAGQAISSSGRGGAGNIRSPSRPREADIGADEFERNVLKNHAETEQNTIHSSGRGGAGNFSRSRSRGPGPSPLTGNIPTHSTGRGGHGNLVTGLASNTIEEEEQRQHRHAEGIHSTGRGGAANITSTQTPAIEHHTPASGDHGSSGRGGAGNIRDRSSSREPGARGSSTEKNANGGIRALWNKVTHPNGPPAGSSASPTRGRQADGGADLSETA